MTLGCHNTIWTTIDVVHRMGTGKTEGNIN